MLSKSLVAAAALAAMVSPALAPASARADECMCVPASMGFVREQRVLQSAEVGPFFSSDGSTLLSDLLNDALDDVPHAHRGEREQGSEVLWCVSSDDPRCSPRDSAPNDGPGSIDATHVAASGAVRPRVGPPSLDGGFARAADRGARPGVRDRVERPPSR